MSKKYTAVVLQIIAKTGKITVTELCRKANIRWYNVGKNVIDEMIAAGVIDNDWNVTTNVVRDFNVINQSKNVDMLRKVFSGNTKVYLKDIVAATGKSKLPDSVRADLSTLCALGEITRKQDSVTSPVYFI